MEKKVNLITLILVIIITLAVGVTSTYLIIKSMNSEKVTKNTDDVDNKPQTYTENKVENKVENEIENSVTSTNITETPKKVENTNKTEDTYKEFLNGLSNMKEACMIRTSSNTNGKNAVFILGTDKKVYIETDDNSGTKIPGAKGTGGDYEGKYTGIDNVVRIFEAMYGGVDSGAHGILVLKTDGSLYLLRNPADGNYKLEKVEKQYIVDVYVPVSPYGRTYCIDILGNSHVVE